MHLTPAQLAEVRQLAVEWRAATSGDRAAQLALVEKFISGRGARQSNVEAYRWLTMAMGRAFSPIVTPPPGSLSEEQRNLLLERRNALTARMTVTERMEAEDVTKYGLPKQKAGG